KEEKPEIRDKHGNLYRWVNGCYRRVFGGVPQLKVVEQAKPEPQPEEEEEEEVKKPEHEAEPDIEDRVEKPIRLDLEAPYDIARLFIRFNEDKEGNRTYVFAGKIEGELIKKPILYRWKSDFKCWNGQFYDDVDDGTIRAQVYDFLDQAVEPKGVRIKPKPK